MAQHNLLDTDTANLNDIFTNGRRYQVPVYQRDYSWTEENWDDLWNDILNVYHNENRVHYMGSVVLQNLQDKSYSIIDGQQRLATLSIVALAIVKRIQDLIDAGIEVEQNEERKKRYMEQYIGSKDGVSLRYSNKLKLNENNEGFYSGYLVQFRPPINEHKLNASDKLLNQAFQYFYAKSKELFNGDSTGESLADFLQNQIAEKLIFIRIVVENELDAYTVFETLNARGIELSVSDLLKNYLLSLTASSQQDSLQAKDQWNRIIRFTDLNGFPAFLRHYWNSRYSLVRKDQLFKTLRNSVENREKSFELLDNLERNVAVYTALRNPNDELWEGRREITKRIRELKLFNVTQPFPLLLITYEKLNEHFEQVLKLCSVIAFRYNVIGGLNPNNQEIVFHKVANKVFNGALTNSFQIAQELKEIYPSDEQFSNTFSTKGFNTRSKKKLVRYILYAIENQIAQTERDFEDETATIEHILPENPSADWQSSFSIDEQENYIYRLGNLTLLETSKNNECGTKPFEEKEIIYKTSQYKMTNTIDYPEWTPVQVRSRQHIFGEIAKTVWKISQISN